MLVIFNSWSVFLCSNYYKTVAVNRKVNHSGNHLEWLFSTPFLRNNITFVFSRIELPKIFLSALWLVSYFSWTTYQQFICGILWKINSLSKYFRRSSNEVVWNQSLTISLSACYRIKQICLYLRKKNVNTFRSLLKQTESHEHKILETLKEIHTDLFMFSLLSLLAMNMIEIFR